MHAGAAYVDPLRQHLVAAGATITEPLAGLKLDPRLAWYGRGVQPHDTSPEPSAPSAPTPNVSELVTRLTDVSIALSPSTFLATGGDGLRAGALLVVGRLPRRC